MFMGRYDLFQIVSTNVVPELGNTNFHEKCPIEACCKHAVFFYQELAQLGLSFIEEEPGTSVELMDNPEVLTPVENWDTIIDVYLTEHVETEHTEETEHVEDTDDNNNNCFPCQCGNAYKSKYTLKRHQRKHNITEEIKCPICSKPFITCMM
ncbi:unnamed protein product [Mytilus coruscus]|uniref:C2H2-type domain-containing protein n=1 Tax=Mytilus coruscus TaxID=42192 RepID=A0A6J8C6P7_MYTCO|nr:unnamed protein product [Mytilus coruscus]